ncbi:MAG: helix-turn-helix domain-containing protein [Bdellovibrionales bacterium]
MKKTGELLKQKRESSHLSLSEVALATKINPKILAAIENGDEESLPAKTFLKGFVRSYALFLKMDPEEVMRVYHEEHGGVPERPVEVPRESTPAPASRRRSHEENSSGMRTLAVVVIVILIGLIIGVRELIEKYQAEKVVETPSDLKVSPIVTPPENEIHAASSGKKSPAAKSEDDEGKRETESTAKVPDAPAGEAGGGASGGSQPPAAVSPSPAVQASNPAVAPAPLPVAPVPPVPQVVAPTPVPPVLPPPSPAPASVPATNPAGDVAENKPDAPAAPEGAVREVILEALDKVDVSFQVHGENRKISLAPTQVHTIQADQPLMLNFSDGGAVNIILNGRERGVPGDLGKPKQVKIP